MDYNSGPPFGAEEIFSVFEIEFFALPVRTLMPVTLRTHKHE
jgi:hypothetical protein